FRDELLRQEYEASVRPSFTGFKESKCTRKKGKYNGEINALIGAALYYMTLAVLISPSMTMRGMLGNWIPHRVGFCHPSCHHTSQAGTQPWRSFQRRQWTEQRHLNKVKRRASPTRSL
ncbi:hypothetical protein TcCL_NonESM11647, partial [Trypanosoma cruzi]